MKTELLESDTFPTEYDFIATEAIVRHPRHGLLYLSQAFGGMDSLAGGCCRWEHGVVCRLQDGDTLAALRGASWDVYMDGRTAMRDGCDPNRPILPWDGDRIAAVARSVGL